MLTLDNVDVKGKTVFCRVDLNSPVDEKTKQVSLGERIPAHAKTVAELADKGAKVVVLAHQGRKGDYDFISLAPHAKMLENEVGKPVKFVDDVCGEKAQQAIKALQPGEILLLENVRFMDDETKFKTADEYANSTIVKNLAPLCDIFVLDAFSASHRAQASIVGFQMKPCVAGRVMQREIESVDKVKNPKKPCIFVLGGAKPSDSLPIMEHWLMQGKVDKVLTGGALGSLFVLASGKELGNVTLDFLKKQGAVEMLPKAKDMLAKYKDRIDFPTDVALDDGGRRRELPVSSLPSPFPIEDIGEQTAQRYAKAILVAKTVVINGPMGIYEKDEFGRGTHLVLKAAEKSSAFSLVGGGHTLSAIDKFKIDKSKLGYISLAGKALIAYLSGEKLAGVEMLQKKKLLQF